MRRYLALLGAAVLLVMVFMILPIHGESGIYENVIRLHVLANSDSEQDQALKLVVRDAILAQTKELLGDVSERDRAQEILTEALPALEQTAQQALATQGVQAPVSVSLGRESYPTKEYESLAFPAGEYLSLRVMIGEAKGQNWWCVLFPPLCLSAASNAEETQAVCLSAGLTDEQYRMIADTDSPRYKLRFKILEVAQELFG